MVYHLKLHQYIGFFQALSHNTVFVFQIQFVKVVKGVKKSAGDLGAPRSVFELKESHTLA